MRSLIAVLGGLLACGVWSSVAAIPAGAIPTATAPDARTVCTLHDPRINEASGIARGLASPGVFYVLNDSGDTNRFFALDARTCRTVATVAVRGARNVDWEDLAVARDAAGTPSVWLGDIGDNAAGRGHVTVYRLAEPRLADAAGRAATRTVGVAETWRARYPDGPADAESLAVAPGGTAYVMTKSVFGASTVYRLPAHPTGVVQVLPRIADVQLTPVGSGRFGVARALLATGAAFSRDGTRFAVRTYSGAFVWSVADGDLAAALRARPATVALPPQRQGVGIAIDGTRLLLDSEGAGTAILSVPVPAAVAGAPSASASLSRSASASPSPSPSPSKKSSYGSGGSWIPGLIIFGLVIIGSILWWSGQRSRPPRSRER